MPNLRNFLYVLTNTTKTNVYLETGTFQGLGIKNVMNSYENVHSIELSKHWYDYSFDKFKDNNRVHLHIGDSKYLLSDILQSIEEPVTVHLDAHYSGGLTAYGDEETPLLHELQILKQRKYDDIIIIDDARMLGKTGLSGFRIEDDPWLHQAYPLMTYDWQNVTLDNVTALIKNDYIHLVNDYGVYSDGAWDQIILIKNNTDKTRTVVASSNNTPSSNNAITNETNETIELSKYIDIIKQKDETIIRLHDEIKKLDNINKAFNHMYQDLESKSLVVSDTLRETTRYQKTLLKSIALGKKPNVKYERGKVSYDVLNTIFVDNYIDRGPMILSTLPYYDDFTAFETRLAGDSKLEDKVPYFESGHIPNQLTPYMDYDVINYNQTWSNQLIDVALSLAKQRVDISPEYYEYTALDFYSAFSAYSIADKKVLVAGSICPWIEAIALAFNASEVITSESSDIISQSDLIQVLKPTDVLKDYIGYFDVVVSFSNIEHNGLGRHGDLIDPFGDFAAMNEFNTVLKPDGLLFLGVPVASIAYVNDNIWRTYSLQRLTAMIESSGFELIDIIQDHYAFYDHPNIDNINGKLNDWQNQPILILRKI